VLNERPSQRAPRVRFEQELADFLSDETAMFSLGVSRSIDATRYHRRSLRLGTG
jgi:hypothetical protein